MHLAISDYVIGENFPFYRKRKEIHGNYRILTAAIDKNKQKFLNLSRICENGYPMDFHKIHLGCHVEALGTVRHCRKDETLSE